MLGASGVRRRLPRAMHSRDYALFVVVVLAMNLGTQMIAVAIGWQVYAIHHRAFDLGLIGLLEFGPLFLLALPAGALTDRISRRVVLGFAALAACMITGWFGSQLPVANLNMTLFWIVFVLCVPYLTALIGDFYSAMNPWAVLVNALEKLIF